MTFPVQKVRTNIATQANSNGSSQATLFSSDSALNPVIWNTLNLALPQNLPTTWLVTGTISLIEAWRVRMFLRRRRSAGSRRCDKSGRAS
jgi:hypothetical protein